MSKYGVFSSPHFPAFGLNRRDTSYLSVFSPNLGKYGPGKTPYLDTFHAVNQNSNNSKYKNLIEMKASATLAKNNKVELLTPFHPTIIASTLKAQARFP